MGRGDSMILTFDVPPLADRDYVISIGHCSELVENSKNWEFLAREGLSFLFRLDFPIFEIVLSKSELYFIDIT